DTPQVVHAVTAAVAGLRVLAPEVERLAFVRPLLRAVVSRDDRVVARRLRVGPGVKRRPVHRALRVARALVVRVAVERVQGPPLCVDEDTLVASHRHRRCGEPGAASERYCGYGEGDTRTRATSLPSIGLQ